MKLQILKKTGGQYDCIKGYTIKLLEDNGTILGLEDIEDNECDEIIMKDILDKINSEFHELVFNNISKKLRLKGKMYFTFTSGYLVKQTGDINKIIKENQSVSNIKDILNILNKNSLLIETLTVSGEKYELSVHRKS
jgi:hypothetical protein